MLSIWTGDSNSASLCKSHTLYHALIVVLLCSDLQSILKPFEPQVTDNLHLDMETVKRGSTSIGDTEKSGLLFGHEGN